MSVARGKLAAGGRYESSDLQHDTTGERHPVSLRFRNQDLEAAFLVEQAQDRQTVLACLFCFDILTFVVRSLQLLTHKGQHRSWATIVPQIEEVLLSSAVALAVTSLLLNLQKGSGQDYAFACFFLISATLLLRVRWFLGSAVLALPVLAVFSAPLWGSELPHVLPHDAELHLTIAWALGALIAYLADDHRRRMFVRIGTSTGKGLSGSLGWGDHSPHNVVAA
ncbi:g6350 [Coccomyxa viridis]|uniref:G6350 protein n=1 Tax=Coccomyxa viridis TaxID=1274662 RepID=A0ABP1G018_9CHLO